MNKPLILFKKSFSKITSTIAFYPSVISAIGVLLFILVTFLEDIDFIISLKDNIPWLFIKGRGEATLVVSTLAGSVISLMVFSFSMVMVVLNRASSSLSPRVLPGLISDRRHQVVLGFYLATIIYNLLMLINFAPEFVPSFGVFISLIMGITCMVLFVFFIHSISSSVKVESIIQRIFKNTLVSIKSSMLKNPQDPINFPEQGSWNFNTSISGYLKEIQDEKLMSILVKHNIKMEITEPVGFFMIKNYLYLKVYAQTKPSDEVIDQIRDNILFYTEDYVYDHYRYGFTQLSEIALKALSPGINDPGTGLKCLDLLSVLFIEKMEKWDRLYYKDKEGEPRIFFQPVSIDYLLEQNFLPIRHFGQGDLQISLKLLEVCNNLLYVDQEIGRYKESIKTVILSCIQSANTGLKNNLDRIYYNRQIEKIENHFNLGLKKLPTESEDLTD
jgi:uncharacterized membrane protein